MDDYWEKCLGRCCTPRCAQRHVYLLSQGSPLIIRQSLRIHFLKCEQRYQSPNYHLPLEGSKPLLKLEGEVLLLKSLLFPHYIFYFWDFPWTFYLAKSLCQRVSIHPTSIWGHAHTTLGFFSFSPAFPLLKNTLNWCNWATEACYWKWWNTEDLWAEFFFSSWRITS